MLEENIQKQINVLIERYPQIDNCKKEIEEAYLVLEESYANGNKLLVAGNGGSAADSEHINLSSEYKEKLTSVNNELGKVLGENLQMALPTIALDGHVALTTAYMNDCEPLLCFAQQVNGYGKEGDVFLGISTSGNSKNILYAAVVAKAQGMKVVALTGAKDSKLSQIADVTIKAPETRTYRIQEYHLPIYHCLCLMLEERFFGDNN